MTGAGGWVSSPPPPLPFPSQGLPPLQPRSWGRRPGPACEGCCLCAARLVGLPPLRPRFWGCRPSPVPRAAAPSTHSWGWCPGRGLWGCCPADRLVELAPRPRLVELLPLRPRLVGLAPRPGSRGCRPVDPLLGLPPQPSPMAVAPAPPRYRPPHASTAGQAGYRRPGRRGRCAPSGARGTARPAARSPRLVRGPRPGRASANDGAVGTSNPGGVPGLAGDRARSPLRR